MIESFEMVPRTIHFHTSEIFQFYTFLYLRFFLYFIESLLLFFFHTLHLRKRHTPYSFNLSSAYYDAYCKPRSDWLANIDYLNEVLLEIVSFFCLLLPLPLVCFYLISPRSALILTLKRCRRWIFNWIIFITAPSPVIFRGYYTPFTAVSFTSLSMFILVTEAPSCCSPSHN